MKTIARPSEIRARVKAWQVQGERVAFVPTMGNLHAGHAALVKQARTHAERVIVSVFVNPLQFGPGEDFATYPRTPTDDEKIVADCGADLLFRPEVDDVYPAGQRGHTIINVPEISDILCGQFRPGHFQGVATVVAKLFNIVRPDVALFGEKDFQQLAVIKRMTIDLCLPVEVIGLPTVRESDGLAMSSRNRYLSAEQRTLAPRIFQILSEAQQHIGKGRRDYAALEQAGMQQLTAAGFKPDYFAIRDASNLLPPETDSHHFVILTAARLGRARLIDNVQVRL
jgi:pantoate--beta-alanine ligase